MSQRDEMTLAVLAGGMGTRMGAPKSSLMLGGEPILNGLLQRIGWTGPSLLVTAPGNRRPVGAERFDAEITDPVDGAGPVQGMLSALAAIGTPLSVFVPVDMPRISMEQILELVGVLSSNAAIGGAMCVRHRGDKLITEPFPCVARTSVRDAIQSYWASGGRSMHGLRDAGIYASHNADHWPLETWTNLNTPDDLARWSQRGD